jgi:hypothetical protein
VVTVDLAPTDVACDVTARTARPARVRRYHGGYPQRRVFEVEPSTSRSYASGRLHFYDGRRGLESLGGWGPRLLERDVNRSREVLHAPINRTRTQVRAQRRKRGDAASSPRDATSVVAALAAVAVRTVLDAAA